MIQVSKTELEERKFTPYKITILVNNEEEHENVKKDIKEIESISDHRYYRIGHYKYNSIRALLELIKNHIK